MSDEKQLRQAAQESKRAAREAATCARMGIPFPGETAATLQLFNVMLKSEPGRCVA